MAKKNTQDTQSDARQTRKDYLVNRRQNQETRQVYIGLGIVGGLILLILLVGIVNELFISPNQAVATVNGEDISISDWQERVEYERAQRVILLENQYEAFGGDVGIIQQFAPQPINELTQPEALGQSVLDLMVQETIVRQVAEARGITVSEAEIDAFIGETFNYFGGDSPTPAPTSTEAPMPTPSITPIPTAVITEVVPTDVPLPTATAGPTGTPAPTATPVSAEAFNEELDGLLTQFAELGVSEEIYRGVVRNQLLRQKLTDSLAEEGSIEETAVHTNIFLLFFEDEASATEGLAMVEEEGFLTTWNTFRSNPDPATGGSAFELLDRTQEELAQSLGNDVASAIFELEVDQASGILTDTDMQNGTSRYFIVQASGFEEQELTGQELAQLEAIQVSTFINDRMEGNVDYYENWRNRVPTQPRIDPKFLAQPTAAPTTANTVPEVPAEDAPAEEGGE